MKCQYCGAELPNGNFCTNCGKPVPAQPEAFRTEQPIPTPPQQTSPQPQQPAPSQSPQQPRQVPAQSQQQSVYLGEPFQRETSPESRQVSARRQASSQQQAPARRQTSMQPQQAAAQRQGAQKKKLKPGAIVAIVLGSLLAAFVVLWVVLRLLVAFSTHKPANKTMTPEEQTQQLIQYAESKAWLADCSIEKTELGAGYTTEHVRYYTQDFDNDGSQELVITAFDGGKNAECLLYAFIDGKKQLWTSFSYEADDNTRIKDMQLAKQENYSGFAVYFTLRVEDDYQYLSVLQLEDNHLTENDTVKGTDECAAYMSESGWELLSGTPIIIFDETLMSSVTPEMLTALAKLYDPQNAPDETGMIRLVDGTVYVIEQAGLYRFVDGEKQLLCKAPEGIKFSLVDGFLTCNGSFYMLGIRDLADGTQEYQVFRANDHSRTAEKLFTMPDRVELLKVDEQYIYAQTSTSSDDTFGKITVYDRQGTEIETLVVPQTWATDGKLVMGMDRKRNCSVITADGQYLMENLPVKDAKLVDGSVYYLTSGDTSATLYRLTAIGKTITVGTVPSTEVSFRQRADTWLVEVYDDDGQKTYYDLEKLEKVYSEAEIKAQIPEAISISSIDFEQDAVTGTIYLTTTYAPHGNSGPLYRLKTGQFELLRNKEEEVFYWMFYDNMVYYGCKDYSNGEPYMQAPMLAGCVPVEKLSQLEELSALTQSE